LGFVTFTCDFVRLRFLLFFFSIFVVGFDLVLPEFECKSSDDLSGIVSCPIELHLCKLRDRILLI
jgi:hypothetical protein